MHIWNIQMAFAPGEIELPINTNWTLQCMQLNNETIFVVVIVNIIVIAQKNE